MFLYTSWFPTIWLNICQVYRSYGRFFLVLSLINSIYTWIELIKLMIYLDFINQWTLTNFLFLPSNLLIEQTLVFVLLLRKSFATVSGKGTIGPATWVDCIRPPPLSNGHSVKHHKCNDQEDGKRPSLEIRESFDIFRMDDTSKVHVVEDTSTEYTLKF